MNEKSIPTRQDWGEIEDNFGLNWSFQKFFGKSVKEMLPYFEEHPLSASEALVYMPEVPFRYYMFCFKEVLLSEKCLSTGLNFEAPNLASTFLLLLESKLTESPSSLVGVIDQLMPVAEFVALNQERYNADIDIYGSFPELLTKIKQLASRL
ncbi:MAG: hypothetical protein IPP57_26160 [Candidatus Obscuribacter sp.]|jgi:hypothetical protein|nr:hypothetical protein [Candidatus Obscuribacter sp.]MBK7837293.1 hypothetical protein [Candidatus Obscuribacter sp.]MBK9774263.1 hypothetical protein [Candidatus Obscuribacter sp.]